MEFQSATIQIKAAEQYFLVVLFHTACKMVQTVESVNVAIPMKATGNYFLVTLVTGCAVLLL